jgi:hypothetical protein
VRSGHRLFLRVGAYIFPSEVSGSCALLLTEVNPSVILAKSKGEAFAPITSSGLTDSLSVSMVVTSLSSPYALSATS